MENNKQNYHLFMDVSGDIMPEIAQKGNLHLIPMEFIIDGEVHVYDDTDKGLDLVKFYDEIKKKINISTTQITPANYENIFESYLSRGESVLCLCLSSGLSSTYQSACAAAKNLKAKYPQVDLIPIDSLGATGTMGIIAERMIDNRANGLSIQENYDDIAKFKSKINTLAAIGDLVMLKRGGRISSTTAFFGGLLKVHPVIQIIKEDGKLRVLTKKIGTEKSLQFLFDYFVTHRDPQQNFVYILHSNEPEKTQQLAAKIKDKFPEMEIRIRFLSPIIGAHLGPDTVVLSFIDC